MALPHAQRHIVDAADPDEAVHVIHQFRQELDKHPYLTLREISGEFHDGALTLRGRLPTYFLKQIAQLAATRVDGVRHIINQIEVKVDRDGNGQQV